MKHHTRWFAIVGLMVSGLCHGQCARAAPDKILLADVRPRPPEMVVNETTGENSGPLLVVLMEAARSIGYCVEWRVAPFPRSLAEIESGSVDIVPRLVVTDERKRFVQFLGPIGVKQTAIEFLLKRARTGALTSYEDLHRLTVGVKRGTAYFESFDKDTRIRRMEALDDENLAKMFQANRIDTMAVLDRAAIEKVLQELGIEDFAWAPYKVPFKLGIYFGMSKASKHIGVAGALSNALQAMARTGRIRAIYAVYGVEAPDATEPSPRKAKARASP